MASTAAENPPRPLMGSSFWDWCAGSERGSRRPSRTDATGRAALPGRPCERQNAGAGPRDHGDRCADSLPHTSLLGPTIRSTAPAPSLRLRSLRWRVACTGGFRPRVCRRSAAWPRVNTIRPAAPVPKSGTKCAIPAAGRANAPATSPPGGADWLAARGDFSLSGTDGPHLGRSMFHAPERSRPSSLAGCRSYEGGWTVSGSWMRSA
jgi:hypothetical protein